MPYPSGEGLIDAHQQYHSERTLHDHPDDNISRHGYPAPSHQHTELNVHSPNYSAPVPPPKDSRTPGGYKILDEENQHRATYIPSHVSQKGRTGRCRCCCGGRRPSRKCCIWCGVITLLLLIGIGLTIFFVFPRIGDVEVSSPYLPTTTAGIAALQAKADPSDGTWRAGLNHEGSPFTASRADPFILSIGFGINITVPSNSFVPYKLNSIDVDGNLLDVNGKVIDSNSSANVIKISSLVRDNTIEPKTESVIVLPVTVNYTVVGSLLNPQTMLQDPVFAVLASACGIPGLRDKDGSEIRIKVNAVLDIKGISWLGVRPKIEREVGMTCSEAISDALDLTFSQLALAAAGSIFSRGAGKFAPVTDDGDDDE